MGLFLNKLKSNINLKYLLMDSGIIIGIVTVLFIFGIMTWLYSIGKNYESKKKKRK
jgi:hypothetical protein